MKVQVISTKGCAICKHLLDMLENLKRDFPHIIIEEIDGEKHPEMVQEYGIKSFPALIIDGHIESTGPISEHQLDDILARHRG